MGMENQSQLQNVPLEQSLFENQASQSKMIPLESQARNPMEGRTRSFSSSSSSGVMDIICPCNFQDHFDQENSDQWLKSDWKNVDPIYLNAWLSDPNHIKIADGNLQLTLDDEPCIDNVSLCHGQDFASGQYYTACDDFRYGNLSARIKAGKGNGVITSMYLFEDGGAAGEQDEIDIEIFGKDAVAAGRWEMQTNYLRQGNMGNCWEPYGVPEACHVGVIPLSFDPTESYHNYTISWIGEGEICTEINWYVDNKLRRHVWLDGNGYIHSNIYDESGNIIESSNIYQGSLPNAGSRIILGLWAAQNWELAGEFNYGSPINAKFDWMIFSQTAGWKDLGGFITSNPFIITDSQDRTHIFARGGDNALWHNLDGTWLSLGGVITSDPFAIKDSQGTIHVLVRGADNALWDRTVDGGWTYLGGIISSNPSAALSSDNHIKVAVKGADSALWMKDITTGSWTALGGFITSNPQAILDSSGRIHVMARGSDNSLWDNIDGSWISLGGIINSDPKPCLNPANPGHIYTFVQGGDSSLWRNDLDTGTNVASWSGLGGIISPTGGSIDEGNPAPVLDINGVIHSFVQGADGALWDNAGGAWQGLGGAMKSSPSAIRDANGWLNVAAIGGDDSLWVYRLPTE